MDPKSQINAWFKNFEHRFDKAIPHIVAETATEYFKDRFKKQNWDNKPWKELSPGYAAKKTRGQNRILTRTGALQASIKPAVVSPQRVVISAGNSRVPYARAHNEGLSIRGIAEVRSYTNRNFMGKGKAVKIKAHSRAFNVQMPRRQFMGHSQFLNAVLMERIKNAYNR